MKISNIIGSDFIKSHDLFIYLFNNMEVFTILCIPVLKITMFEHDNRCTVIYGLDFVWGVMVTRLLRVANTSKIPR
jgi:hypothetical protein